MNYTMIRSKIKNIYIQIKDGEVIVKAPRYISKKNIEQVMAKKQPWIAKKLKEEQQRKIKEEEEEPITRESLLKLKEIVNESAHKYAKSIGEYPNKITIKDMKYAWGSCTGKRNIAINMKLANKPEKITEYVVLHELCHLKHMNHSKDFWALVEKNMKDYKIYRKQLKS